MQGTILLSTAVLMLATGVSVLSQSVAEQPQMLPVERGEHFTVYGGTSATVDSDGNTVLSTNKVTLMDNSRNYLENGEWKESEDLIEATPDGAVAKRGPTKAIFNGDLNREAVLISKVRTEHA
jgi:hypothetical protein